MFDHNFAVDAGRVYVKNIGSVIDDRPELETVDLVYWDDRTDEQILCFAEFSIHEEEFPQLESDRKVIKRMSNDVRKWLENNSDMCIDYIRFDVIDMIHVVGDIIFTRHQKITCSVHNDGEVMFE